MDLVFKNIVPTDALNTLRKAVGWAEYSQRQLELAEKNSDWAICVCDGEKVVATARAVGDCGCQCMLCDVIVLPEYQGKGIGRMMLESFIEYVKSIKQGDERVLVHIFAYEGKEKFYEKFGFISRPSPGFGPAMTQYIV